MKLTVFTPTFNRAHLLPKVYESLVSQTYKEFEWIVIDDGSVDNTEQIVQNFVASNKLDIKYHKQQNKGKHFAINKGVQIANGVLFVMLDSDDVLPPNALELIEKVFYKTNEFDDFGGLAGRKAYFDGTLVGSNTRFASEYCNSLDFRYKLKIQGDVAEVFLTSVLKEFPFPEIENEKFCPEALVWNRIAQKYKLYFFNESIYNCEYLPDGLTAKIVKIRMTSPIASMLTYSELASYNIPLLQKIKATINFWRFSFNSNLDFTKKFKMSNLLYSTLGFPLGLFLFIKDKIQQ